MVARLDWLRTLPNGGVAMLEDGMHVAGISADLVSWTPVSWRDGDQLASIAVGPTALFASRVRDASLGTSFDGITWSWGPNVGTNEDIVSDLLYVGPR